LALSGPDHVQLENYSNMIGLDEPANMIQTLAITGTFVSAKELRYRAHMKLVERILIKRI
jgi:hypothetical protein